MTKLREKIMVELAYCHHVDLTISETAKRIEVIVMTKHLFWGAGELGCPREIKAGNGELHTLKCKICGENNPRSEICLGAIDQ